MMSRNLFGVFASLLVAGTLVTAQEGRSPAPASPPSSPQQSAPDAATDPNDKTFTGCLTQGSGPNTYILDNAKPEAEAKDAKGQRFLLEINAQPDQLKPVMNSHVRIVGMTAESAPPAAASDQPSAEASMSKITVKRITRLAATCPATTTSSSMNN